MKLKVVKASQGGRWVMEGLMLAARQPMGYMSLMGLIMTTAMLLVNLPVLGPLTVVCALPAVWMVFILASQQVLAGRKITPALVAVVLRDKAQRLQWFKLGGLYVGATLAVMVLGGLVGPDMAELAKALEALPESGNALADPVIQSSLMWRVALSLPISLVFWHTPALLFWGRQPLAKALFFSIVACWRNLTAFVLYGLGWLAVVASSMVSLQALEAAVPIPFIHTVAAVLLGMWVASAFYASMFATVRDCFEGKGQGAEPKDDSPELLEAVSQPADETDADRP